MITLETAKDLFIEQKDASKEAKHDIRRGVSEAAKRVADVSNLFILIYSETFHCSQIFDAI